VSTLSEEHRQQLAELPTASLSDAMDGLGMSGTMTGIVPLGSRVPYRMVGTARTISQGARHVGAEAETAYTRHPALVESGLHAGDVVVLSTPPDIAASSWGYLLSLRCKLQGVTRTVLDGSVRDPAQIVELGYALYTRPGRFCPAGSKLGLETLAVDAPVVCGGVHVSPGHVLVGDDSGVVVILPQRVPEVIEGARRIVAHERELAQRVMASGSLTSVGVSR
jgi:regulator of RNase E activity RraA